MMAEMKTARDAALVMEPAVLDTHVAAMVAMTVWESVQHTPAPDGSIQITSDEREQMQRVMMDVLQEATVAKARIEECEGALA